MKKIVLIFFFLSSFVQAAETWIEIADPTAYDQVVAVSDVHGNKKALVQLLIQANVIDAQLNLTSKKTLLVIVGDSIQSGKDSLGTLDFLISLQKKMSDHQGRLIHTLGNHESRRLSGVQPRPELQAELDAQGITFSEFISPSSEYGKFLNEMPLAVRVSDVLFVHSGDIQSSSLQELLSKFPSFETAEDYARLSESTSPVESENWLYDQKRLKKITMFMKNEGLHELVYGHERRSMGEEYINDIVELKTSALNIINIDSNIQSGTNQWGGVLVWKKSTMSELLSHWKHNAVYLDANSATSITTASGDCSVLLEGLLKKLW